MTRLDTFWPPTWPLSSELRPGWHGVDILGEDPALGATSIPECAQLSWLSFERFELWEIFCKKSMRFKGSRVQSQKARNHDPTGQKKNRIC